MNAQQLKNAILQEAIEGRLVPQDPNDEPASVLLQRIRKEKERLVKEGKLKKKDLEVKPISEEEKPFEIPEGWEWCRIRDLFETSSGSTPQSKNPKYYSNGSINWVRTTDLNNGLLDSCEIRITKEAVEDYNLSIIPQDSVCIAMYGGGGTIGKHSIIKFDTTINQSVCAIFPNGFCDMNYVHIFMQYQRPYWMNYAAGSRKDPNINQIIIKNCPFPLPPLAEQHRIVAKIEELMPKVEEYGKAQEALDKLNAELPEKLKKSILQEAIEGRLVPQDPNDEPASILLDRIRQEKQRLVKEGKLKKKDLEEKPISEDEKPFEIPESWEWCKLGNVISLLSGRDLTPEEYNSNKDGIPYITGASNFENDGLLINRWTTQPLTISHYGDLLITCKGTIGTMAFNKVGEIHIARQVMSISPYLIDIQYIKFFLMRIVYELDKKAKSIIPGISREDILNALFPLPPLAEQRRIVAKIEELFKEIDKLKVK